MSSHPQVRLVQATVPLLYALNEDRTRFAELIGSPVPAGWPEFPEAVGFTLHQLQTAPEADRAWSMQFFLDHTTGRLLGSGGFAGPPAGRTVEIGYEVAPEFRGRGFGTAAARALIERAAASGAVDHVIAHTLPGPNASTAVLASLGFDHVADQDDPEVGTVRQWRRCTSRTTDRPADQRSNDPTTGPPERTNRPAPMFAPPPAVTTRQPAPTTPPAGDAQDYALLADGTVRSLGEQLFR